MTYIIDIVIVLIFAVVVFMSAKKGFFRSFIDLLGSLIAIIAARVLSVGSAETVYNAFVAKGVENALSQNLGEVGTTDYTQQIESVLASIPDSLNGILQIIGIDKTHLTEMVSQADLNGSNLVESLMSIVSPVVIAAVQLVLFFIFAIILIFAIKLLSRLLDRIVKKLPVIKSCNKILGAVFGILRGFIIVVIISMLFSVVASFTTNAELIANVESSYIITAVKGIMTSLIGLNF